MKPLIVAATRFEIAQSIPLLEEKEIPYLITGVGMVATAYTLGKYLANQSTPTLVINVGIGGAFDKNIPLGDVVAISSDTFYELGAEDGEKFVSIDDLGFGSSKTHANSTIDINLPSQEAITVNRVHGNEESIKRVLERIPSLKIESMEGAAVFYACNQEGLNCIQIRAISNYVERRDKSSWKVSLAIENLNNWLKKFIEANY